MYYECDESNKKNIHDNIKERKHTIKDLHPYRCYRMRVTCESRAGLGTFSDWVESQTKPGSKRGVRVQDQVVERLDNAIHRINRYPLDKC